MKILMSCGPVGEDYEAEVPEGSEFEYFPPSAESFSKLLVRSPKGGLVAVYHHIASFAVDGVATLSKKVNKPTDWVDGVKQ